MNIYDEEFHVVSISIETPFVSVVMPVYNVEKYIDEAIASILNQTFSDFEFIIVDDGSTDNTWDILQTYTDERIILLRNEINIGNYPSRNRGIRVAKGKYIAVMDGDDIVMPDRLEKQYCYLDEHPDLTALGSNFLLSTGTKKYDPPLIHEDICFALLRDFSILHPSFMILAKTLHLIDILTSFGKDGDEINKLIISAYLKMNQPQFLSFLDEWYYYGRYNQKEFMMKYPLEPDEVVLSELEKHKEWIKEMRINSTPVVLFNGFKLPQEIYKLEDIPLLTEFKLNETLFATLQGGKVDK